VLLAVWMPLSYEMIMQTGFKKWERTNMINATTPVADLDKMLMGFSTDCYCWHVFDENEHGTGAIRKRPNPDCPDCGGSGVRYPLRKICPGETHNPCHEEIKCLWSYEYRELPTCTDGYVYNDAPDALTEAVRAKGWDYKIVSFKDGDYAMIRGCMVNGTRDRGVVIPDEELRGYDALKLAVCRAIEATGSR